MSWSEAVEHAFLRSCYFKRKIYVRGYQTSLGKWRYGTYATPTPPIQGRTW